MAPRRSMDISKFQTSASSSKVQENGIPAKHPPSIWHPSTHWNDSAAQQHQQQQILQPGCQQLAVACKSRDVKQLQALLAQGVPCISDAADAAGNTALHLALLPAYPAADTPVSPRQGGCGGLSWLTGCFGDSTAGASVGRAGSSLSGTASLQAQQHMVAALLAAGADANARNHQGLTPLMLAVQQLLDAACSSSSLVASALKVLEQLCKQVLLDPNMKDYDQGRTALVQLLEGRTHAAAAAGTSSTRGKPQVHDSVRSTSAQTSKSASHSTQRPAAATLTAYSAVLAAVQLKAADMLLHCGADCNAADKSGMTPLMFAAAQPGVTKELLQPLLERGANTRQLDNRRRSALTHALLAHYLQLMPAVGASGSGRSACCCSSASSAVAAPSAGGHKAVQHAPCADTAATLDADAAPGSTSASCSSACDSCASPDLHATVQQPCSTCGGSRAAAGGSGAACQPDARHSMVVRALCSYGALDLHPASINTRFPGLNSFTQLHIAMRRGDVMAAQMLLAGGADVNATDVWGNSPLMYWPVVPAQPAELVEELVGKLLSHVSAADSGRGLQAGWGD